MKFYYYVNEKPNREDYRLKYEDRYVYEDHELWMAVHDIAHDYYYNNDGYEHTSWPNDLYLWNDKHEYLGKFAIDMETVPSFTATRIQDDD